MTAPTPDEAAALRSQWNADCADLRMDAYYYGFDGTGARAVDLVLSAVASAGKGSHHTEDWGEFGYVEQIQEAADAAAKSVRELLAECDALRRDLATALAERDEFRDERDKDRAHARELRRDLVAAREELRGEQATSATLKTHLVSEQARLRAKLAAARPVLDAAAAWLAHMDGFRDFRGNVGTGPERRLVDAVDAYRAATEDDYLPICPECGHDSDHSGGACMWYSDELVNGESVQRTCGCTGSAEAGAGEHDTDGVHRDDVYPDVTRALLRIDAEAGAPAEPTGDTERGTT